MARRRIQPIFDKVLADPRLSRRDKEFVESLQSYYRRKGSLTAGRRHHLLRIEQQLDRPVEEVPQQLKAQIELISARARVVGDDWTVGFLSDIIAGLMQGREMTERQKEIFDQKVAKYNDEALVESEKWEEHFNETQRAKLEYVVEYYRSLNRRNDEGYYSFLIREYDKSPSTHVPSKGTWDKLCDHHRMKTLFQIMDSEPKYKVGEYVVLREGSKSTRHGQKAILSGPSEMTAVCNAASVVDIPDQPPYGAVAGGRLVWVLFFGASAPTLTEERHLKKMRIKK